MATNERLGGPLTLNITRDVIADLGYTHLTEEQASQLLDRLVETLRTIVGYRLARDASAEALQSFSDLSDDDVLAWLRNQAPDHEDVVKQAFEEIRTELRRLTDSAVVA